MALPEKVERLLELLDDVEQSIHSDHTSLGRSVGQQLARRLSEVAELVSSKFCDDEEEVIDITSDHDGETVDYSHRRHLEHHIINAGTCSYTYCASSSYSTSPCVNAQKVC